MNISVIGIDGVWFERLGCQLSDGLFSPVGGLSLVMK